jgi:hypothetical protein
MLSTHVEQRSVSEKSPQDGEKVGEKRREGGNEENLHRLQVHRIRSNILHLDPRFRGILCPRSFDSTYHRRQLGWSVSNNSKTTREGRDWTYLFSTSLTGCFTNSAT